jgi:hypothetical protein
MIKKVRLQEVLTAGLSEKEMEIVLNQTSKLVRTVQIVANVAHVLNVSIKRL